MSVDSATQNRVRERAAHRCEYCLLPEHVAELRHHIEHIIARKHGGSDDFDNLALACHRCNLHKGANLAGIDQETGEIVILFHPRRDHWDDHFYRRGATMMGRSSTGRVTIRVLGMNDLRRRRLRLEADPHP